MSWAIAWAMIWLAWSVPCFAQSSGVAANSTVRVDSLNVYSEARATSEVVRAMKKGDALFVSLELKTGAEKWCSVRLPGESARLGYVECDGLERTDRRSGDLALPAGSVPVSSATPIVGEPAEPTPIHLTRTRPDVESSIEYQKVAAIVVRDDVLDGAKITELDQAAQSGSAEAMTRATLAHFAAADFEVAHNDLDAALEQYLAAVPLAAKKSNLLYGALVAISYIHLVRSEYSVALEYLVQARRANPDLLLAAQLSGWAYYGLNRLDDAIKEWDAAERIEADPDIEKLLEKARRDQRVEQETRAGETSHFILHYQGGATPELAVEILRTLEEDFRSIQSILNFTPAEPIGVILYTDQAFRDVTRAPSWSAALNDGRIRVPVQGLRSMTDELSRILKHELTHSFVKQLTLGGTVEWLSEGLAQWISGDRSAENARGLIAAFDDGSFISLKKLEGSWNAYPERVAAFAYAWSLAAVESVMADSGPQTINRLLADIGTASSVDGALRQALNVGYADLDKQTADYLRKTYKR